MDTHRLKPVPLELPRKLGLADSVSIVVGTVIGSAVFIVPGSVAQSLPSATAVVAVWVLTGALSFFAGLGFAELGAMMPSTGGQYVYLREAYGPLVAFLYGWTNFLVIWSGGVATLAVGFSIYLSHFVSLTPVLARAASIALVAVLTCVNYRGVRLGAGVQNFFTAVKVLALAVLIGSALASARAGGIDWSLAPGSWSWRGASIAAIACFWAYEGWNCASFVAGEIKEPQRNVPRALGLGIAIVVALYVLANVAYLAVLPIREIAATERVAADAAAHSLGARGGSFVALAVLLSIVGATNGNILTGPRVYFAQARDGLFLHKFGEVHPRYETPGAAIVAQGVVSAALCLSGSYEKLFSYVIFAAWLFYGLAVFAVVVLRRKRPDLPRPYRMWGYPVAPVLFSAVAFAFLISVIVSSPGPSVVGLGLIATGVPFYFIWRKRA